MSREEVIYILRNAAWIGTDKEREKVERAVEVAIGLLRSGREEYGNGFKDGAHFAATKIVNIAETIAEGYER